MKKIFKMMFAVVAGVAALTACTNEPEEGITPSPETKTLTVVAQMSDATRAIFTDGEGLKWSIGDVMTAVKASGAVAARPLTAENISDNCATFSFNDSGISGDIYFSLNHNGDAYNKHEYRFQNEITQPAAGGIDPSLIKLMGEKVTLDGSEESVTVNMNLVGTMMRYLVYSGTGEYADEKVISVKLVGNENFSGNGAVIAVNHAKGNLYLQENNVENVGENAVIFWGCYNDYINVTLNVPAALNATNAEGCIGKGIYMPVPPISLSGYKYVVTTDAHQFTFDASDKAVTFAENTVKNVLLDVEKASSVEEFNINDKGLLSYESSISANIALGAGAVVNQNIGYIFMRTQDHGATGWFKRDKNAANEVYYEGISFDCTEDWLSVGYGAGGDNIFVNAEANTASTERTATLTVTFEDANGYIVPDEYKSLTINFTQAAAGSAKTITIVAAHTPGMNAESRAYEHHRVGGYYVPAVDGVKMEDTNSASPFWTDEEVQKVYGSISFVCHDGLGAANPVADWITAGYPTNGEGLINSSNYEVSIDANTSPVERKSLVTIHITTPDGYVYNGESVTNLFLAQFEITQAAGGPEITATLSDILNEAISKDGVEGLEVAKLNLLADGEAIADLNTYADIYKVSISGGATNVAVAANGVITANFPANHTAGEKTYTITVKHANGTTLATADLTQEAGDGSVVEPTDVYTYTIGGWTLSGNTVKNWSWDKNAHSLDYWVIVIQNVAKNDVMYTADMPEEDKKALVCQMFQWTEEEYNNAFVELTVFWGAGETIIKLTAVEENTTGAQRKMSGNIYDAEGAPVVTYEWIQNA